MTEPDLSLFLRQQRARIRQHIRTIADRAERRYAAIEPSMHLEGRGLPQTWHRDGPDLRRFYADDDFEDLK